MTDFNERKKSIVGIGGMVPPQAIEMEASILGSILSHSEYLIDIEESLKPEHFYMESHKIIYKAITDLSANNFPIDIATVSNQLRSWGQLEIVGGNYFVIDLTKNSLKGNVEYHSRILIQKYIQREIIRTSQEIIQEAYNDTTDVFDLIEKLETNAFNVTKDTHSKKGDEIGDLIDSAIELMNRPITEGLTGVGSGFTDLDRITNGWQNSDLIIVAARPAMGKTAFILNCARNAAVKYGKPGVFFSLEMSSIQLVNRMISEESGIKLDRILKNLLTDDEKRIIKEKTLELKKSILVIDDTSSLNIAEFRSKCRRFKKTKKIGFIMVDYLQLMDSGANGNIHNRDNEIGKISRALKKVAKDLEVPVLALSQLSRAVESRPGANKRPMLSDLRESGNIEQDADMVLFLHRPEYYGMYRDAAGRSTIGLCEVIIAKNRQGVCDTVKLDFNGAYMRFRDWNEISEPVVTENAPPKKLMPVQETMSFEITTDQPEELDF